MRGNRCRCSSPGMCSVLAGAWEMGTDPDGRHDLTQKDSVGSGIRYRVEENRLKMYDGAVENIEIAERGNDERLTDPDATANHPVAD